VAAEGPKSYRTLTREGCFEFTEKKSRFIGYAAPALEEPDALAFIESVRARHPGCSALLFAYICGFSGQIQRYHDAHEPSGGLLMLEALKWQAVTGAAAAVARYFGGVKLGAGPLGRAFGMVAAEAIADAQPCVVEKSFLYSVSFEYTQSGGLEHWFEHSPYRLQGLEYGERIVAQVAVKAADAALFLSAIADLTGGRAAPKILSEYYLVW
jgi:putative IMPACT (imprinted ancient) family translation regulator